MRAGDFTSSGAGEYIDIPSSQDFNNPSFTYAGWIYLTGDVSKEQYMVHQGVNSFANFGVYQNKLFNCCSPSLFAGTDVSALANTWIHAAMTYQNGVIAFYLNGQKDGSVLRTVASADSVRIGNWNGASGEQWSLRGKLDDMRIYNRVLSPAEIQELYAYAPGPVLELKMDENSGSLANDSSGYGNSGAFPSSVKWVNGKYGSALATGANNTDSSAFVTIPDNPTLETASDVTLSAWVYPTAINPVGNDRGIIFKLGNQYDCCFQAVYAIGLSQGSGAVYFAIANATAYDRLISPDLVFQNTWTHIAGVKNGSSFKIYVNGAEVQSGATGIGSLLDSANPVFIGQSGGGWGSNPFDGFIDEARVYNYAQTQAQIVQDMNAGHAPAGVRSATLGSTKSLGAVWDDGGFGGAPPVSWWKFDEKAGTSAQDSSGTNTGTLFGGAEWKSAKDCHEGSCLKFDGADDAVNYETPPVLQFSNTQPYTVSTWIRPIMQAPPTTVLAYALNSQSRGWYISYDSTGAYADKGVLSDYWDGSTFRRVASSTNSVPLLNFKLDTVLTGGLFLAL